jgi:hypothetical protein
MSDHAGTIPIRLTYLQSVSPSLAELLRLCPLRAILARSPGSERFVLGSPRAWLGIAYHKVMEGIASSHDPSDSAALVRQLWDGAVQDVWRDAQQHPLNRRFGDPATWPGYHLALAGATLRGQETAHARIQPGGSSRVGAAPCQVARERVLAAMGGRLVGRPDLVTDTEVIDYKSGAIHDTAGDAALKDAYVRQLRVYAYLVHANFGRWPTKGVLVPMLGARVETALVPSACETEAAEANALLDAANSRLKVARSARELATPSALSCRYCPYMIICPGFWLAASPCWAEPLRYAVVEGPLVASPSGIHGGSACGVDLTVVRGPEPQGRTTIAPLSNLIHPDIPHWVAGDQVRFVGLIRRTDGRLVPSIYTVSMRVKDGPELQMPTACESLSPGAG